MASPHTAQRTPAPVTEHRLSGWILFASVIVITAGVMHVVLGLTAMFNGGWVAWTPDAVVVFDLSTWGALHLVWGLVLVVAGAALLTGNGVSRAVVLLVAGLSMVGAFAFLAVNVWWALVVMALDVLVIWAVAVHGDDAAPGS